MLDIFDILVFSETHLTSSPDFCIRNYDCIHMDSTSPRVLDIAILIKNLIIYSVLNLFVKLDISLETIAIQPQLYCIEHLRSISSS